MCAIWVESGTVPRIRTAPPAWETETLGRSIAERIICSTVSIPESVTTTSYCSRVPSRSQMATLVRPGDFPLIMS